ncbi:MAG: bacterial Ig-like domain-containing protein [Treponema sp.]|jgi:hypothetical protein|nr:bacterial Ig-like domain-containing protein [Treponema sp.]
MKKVNRRFFPVVIAVCLNGLLAGASCSNPIYNTSGALDPDDVIAITIAPPTKRLYLWGESLDLTGASANIHYRGPDVPSKPKQTINLSHVSGFDPKKEGVQTLTVTIEGQRAYFDIALLAVPPDSDLLVRSLPVPTNQQGSLPNELNCPWKVYIFSLASRDVAVEKSGKNVPLSFTTPSLAGDYIMALSFTRDGVTTYRFYRLIVS